jgi:hypothetical protein
VKPEERVQRDVEKSAVQLGFHVFALDQGYRPQHCRHCGGDLGKGASGTRQTAGLSDLYLVHTAKRLSVWVEVKAGANTPTDAQSAFLVEVRRAGAHAFPAWCTSDLLWGLHAAGFPIQKRPPWGNTSKRFRDWIRALYPETDTPDDD